MNRIWKMFVTFICFLLLQIICYNHLQSEVADSNDIITNEEYEIFTLLIDSLFLKPDTKQIVICDSTCSPGLGNFTFPKSYGNLKRIFDIKNVKMIDKYLAKDFIQKNSKKYILKKNSFNFNLPNNLLGLSELMKMIADSTNGHHYLNWSKFYLNYPKAQGFSSLSRVGFNKKKNQAFILTDINHGELDAAIYFFLLEKKYGIWRIKKKILWAIS
jgi:hypothetical protein